jgi:hypothetical protein
VFLTITGHRAAESDDVADDAVEDADDQPNAYDEKGRP